MTNNGNDNQPLLQPVRLGALTLANRLVMAPLTRNRSAAGYIPWDLNAVYYAQRASAGLIVSEATAINPLGHGGTNTPGLYTPEQIEGWRLVTRAVHEKGGRMFAQLWHTGRQAPAETIPAGGERQTTSNLTKQGIAAITGEYAQAARNAIAAGFDGVEIHGANGYLLDQFLKTGTNHRSDAYGGSIENRARLLLEVMQAVVEAIGAGRVGLRLSPVTPANDVVDADPQPLFTHVVRALGPMGLAYLHLIEGSTGGPREVDGRPFDYAALRQAWRDAGGTGAWMVNNGYDRALAEQALQQGADLVAFGRPFISNPDLVERLRVGAALNTPDRATFYGGTEKGYTDYPALAA